MPPAKVASFFCISLEDFPPYYQKVVSIPVIFVPLSRKMRQYPPIFVFNKS